MVLKKEITDQIKDLLQRNPQGLSIKEIVRAVNINRNTAGRYLENLLVSGQVEMRRLGMAKIYRISQRVPLSAILSISSDLVIQLDSFLRIIFVNESFCSLVGIDSKNLLGKNIEYTPVALVFDELFVGFIERIREGISGNEWSGEIHIRSKGIIVFCRIAPTVFEDGRRGVSIILEDITQRRQAEQRLAESERQFRLLAENSIDMISRIKPDGTRIYVSPAYKIILGYEPEELIGKRKDEYIHPDDAHILESSQKALTPQNPFSRVIFRTRHKDGHYIWIESNVRAIYDEITGELSEYYTVTRDITERKKNADALRESEERYRTLVHISPDAVLIHEKGKIIFLNPAALFMLGAMDPNDILGKNVLDLIHPDFRDMIRKNIEKDLTGEITPVVELPMLRLDGTTIVVEGRGVKTLFNGNPAIQVALRDVTESKRAEMALRESEGRLRLLLDSTEDLIFMQDPEGRYLYFNAAARFGVSLDEMLGATPYDILEKGTADRIVERVKNVVKNGQSIREDSPFVWKGQTLWFEDSLSPVRDKNGTITAVVTISHNVTESKLAEIALYESEEKYRTFIDRARDGIVVVQDGILKMCNRSVTEFWGGSIDQMLGRNFSDFIHPDALPEVVERYNRRMSGETPPTIYETILKRKDGSRFFAELNAGIISYEGKPADLIIIRDINERKKNREGFAD